MIDQPTVAVITPYFRESEDMLKRCHSSVAAQSYPCVHVMVADGYPQSAPQAWPVEHVTLPRAHNDAGDTPRLVGSYHAIGLGVDVVAYLDADNWYEPDHIASLLKLAKTTKASFLSSNRTLRRMDGSVLGACPLTHPEKHIDTSCMMFMREAYPLLSYWGLMPSYAHPFCDRVMLHYVKRSGLRRAHSDRPSVNYTCGKVGMYRLTGETPPPGAGTRPDFEAAHARWIADGNPPLM